MKVAIDIRRMTEFGVGTYIRNVVRTLARLDRDSNYFLIGSLDKGGGMRAAAARTFTPWSWPLADDTVKGILNFARLCADWMRPGSCSASVLDSARA